LGITYYSVVISGEPNPEQVDNAVNWLKDEPVQVVVGIGGGSVMDAGKAISAMMYKAGSVKEYLEGVGDKEHPGTKIPYIAIPTTAGTGSEATKNAVISQRGRGGFKKSLRHDNLVPDMAIIDPELTLNCPQGITAASGMDCFTQLTEAFLSDKSGPVTDSLAMEGLKAIKSSLKQAWIDGQNIDARSGMSFAALLSGICLANAGHGVVHGFASSIGGMYHIPHGTLCGLLMGPCNEISVRELRKSNNNVAALKKYATLGRLFIDKKRKPDDYYIDGFIDHIYYLTDYFKLSRLRESGIDESGISNICRQTENKNNPVKLSEESLAEILHKLL